MYQKLYTRVLVGWDGSTGSVAALHVALRLTSVDTGRAIALAVVPTYRRLEDQEERAREVAQVRSGLREAYDAAMNAIRLVPGQTAELTFAEADDVARELDSYAQRHQLDLVVVGLHGREGLLHPHLGHIASHAIRMSHCPVLVVPLPGQAGAPPAGDDHSRLSGLFHPFRSRAA